jgi:PAS domain S-box-containing protein
MAAAEPPRIDPAPGWDSAANSMYRAAQAVARSGGGSDLFGELVRELAEILGVATVFVATFADESRRTLRTLAAVLDRKPLRNFEYAIEGTPCAKVVGQSFRHVARGVAAEFPAGTMFAVKGMDSYAAFPLVDREGAPLGLLVAMDRRAIADPALAEALLKIFAGRIVAEVERLRASEALRRSEASYRTIFEAAEDAIFVHDWDSGAILDVNPRGCLNYGYSVEELRRLSVADLSSGEPPYDLEHALQYIELAKLGRCPTFEWHRRNKDGSLHWDEVRLKAAQIDGRAHILAFTREITAHKAALAALRASEEQYRAIFDSSADSMLLWNRALTVADVNRTFTRMSGFARDEVIGVPFGSRIDADDVDRRLELIRAALAGREGRIETRTTRKDGTRFDIELRYLPVNFGGEPHALAIGRDISERKAALAALQAQEQKYRAIFDGTVDSMVLWDRDLRVVDVNDAFVQMTGLQRDQVVGRHWSERPDADDLPQLLPLIERALDGQVGAATQDVGRADGSRFDIELRYLPVRLGDEAFALGVGRDVSERLERERALRDSEAQYRAIFNASADALVLRDADFRIVDVNATYERMSGFARAEVLGLDRIVANPADVAPAIRALHERALGGEPIALEVPLVRRDGMRYEIELRGVPIRHRGQPHVLYIGRDVTERKRAEQALRDSEEQYRAIFNASVDALILWNSRFERVDVNPAYERIYGWTRADVVGRGYDHPLYAEEYARPRRELVQRALAGEACRAELEAVRKTGERIQTEIHAIPFVHRGEPHVLAIARDITERHAAEAERGRLEAQLRQAQKMEAIGQLTGGIAHDFNNILTSVIGYLVLAEERAAALDDERLSRQIGKAQLAAQRARDLIAQMLAFARRQRSERRVLRLAPLVRQTLQLLRATLPSSVRVDVALDDDSGPSAEVDPVQIEQVLFNLCINARDAVGQAGLVRVRLGEAGGGFTCASCRERVGAGHWVALEVADDGSGIPAETMERIFEPFFSTKEVGQGSGMGLAMVHGIVHDHGGHVEVRSRPGRGSSFRVLLPSARAAGAAAAPAQQDGVARSPAAPLEGHVLVVDDEPMVGDFMAELLEGWGLQVRVERAPHEALARLDDPALAVDLVITDQTMPGMTGIELARQALRRRPGLPVLLYTGHAEAIEGALEPHGVRALLRKPVDAEALRALVQRLLGSSPDR